MNWRNINYKVYRLEINTVAFYLIDDPYYFDRDDIYGYNDDLERFAFFQNAFCKLIFSSDFKADVVHLNDWQCGMIPLIYKDQYEARNPRKVRFLMTVHNPAYQGICDKKDLYDYFNLDEKYFDEGLVRLDDKVNFLKTGIIMSDLVTTVSKTHRDELMRGEFAYGLERIFPLKGSDFIGVPNGLDTKHFNPSTDSHIFQNFNIESVLKSKKVNKVGLIKELGLSHPEYPLFGIVGRLASQKGISYLIKHLDETLRFPINLVILGKGEADLENQLAFYDGHYDNLKVVIGYNSDLAHKLYAGADFLLMPSIYEPCGISQMVAMRYGTIPLCSNVGGLRDTVVSYNHLNEDEATGILFSLSDDDAINKVIYQALDIYSKPRLKNKLIHNGMKKVFSWNDSAKEYIRLYKQMMLKNNK
jgi:starch synthase